MYGTIASEVVAHFGGPLFCGKNKDTPGGNLNSHQTKSVR